ncbi:MAG TPA: hypothetical protein VGM21_11820 [Actinomycetota bacterium]
MSPPTLPPLADRAAAGAVLLDRQRAGWAEHVDADRLDMQLEYDDLLGQLCGSFDEGVNALASPRIWPDPDAVAFAVDHGFELGDQERNYADLTGCWRVEITRRRGGEAG